MKRLHISPLSYIFYPLLVYFCGFRVFLIFTLSVLVHEFGHLAVIFILRQKIVSITLAVGGLDIKRYGFSSYMNDALVSVSGPLLGFIVALWGRMMGYADFYSVGMVYSAFNLLPIYPLDGGCFLRAILFRFLDCEIGIKILHIVSTVFLFLIYLGAVMLLLFTEWNVSLLVICVCVFFVTFLREKK